MKVKQAVILSMVIITMMLDACVAPVTTSQPASSSTTPTELVRPAPVAPTKTDSTFTKYSSPDYRYSIWYPATWIADKGVTNSLVRDNLVISGQKPDYGCLMVFVLKNENRTLEYFANLWLQNLKNQHSNLVLLENKPTGRWAWYMECQDRKKFEGVDVTEMDYLIKSYFMMTESYVYIIQTIGYKLVYDSYPFDAMVNSFKLTD